MRGHGCKLKRLLRPVVESYLDEPTCTLAARRAGIARSTLFVWIKLPEFERMVDQVLLERARQRLEHVEPKNSQFEMDQCIANKISCDRDIGRPVA